MDRKNELNDVPGLDLPALHSYLDGALLPGTRTGPLRAELISGGRSNLTYVLSDGHQDWVLRRPPLGHALETAHDMGREVRVLRALQGTAVPVPRVLAFCADTEVLGAPFYVMERVEGTVLRDHAGLAALTEAQTRQLGYRLLDILAALHSVEPGAVGLADFGKPDGYLERQLRRWAKQLAASHTREVSGIHALADRLAASLPVTQRGAVVHGDYRLDNAIVSAEVSEDVRAVLDWEMATLGDPLADFGMFCMYNDGWEGLDNPVLASPSRYPGFPGRSELAERYAAQTGLTLGRLDWYVAFAFYKTAVVLEGIHCRYLQGRTVGPGFEKLGALVPELVARGLAALPR